MIIKATVKDLTAFRGEIAISHLKDQLAPDEALVDTLINLILTYWMNPGQSMKLSGDSIEVSLDFPRRVTFAAAGVMLNHDVAGEVDLDCVRFVTWPAVRDCILRPIDEDKRGIIIQFAAILQRHTRIEVIQ